MMDWEQECPQRRFDSHKFRIAPTGRRYGNRLPALPIFHRSTSRCCSANVTLTLSLDRAAENNR
jgi:hypothetical protein